MGRGFSLTLPEAPFTSTVSECLPGALFPIHLETLEGSLGQLGPQKSMGKDTTNWQSWGLEKETAGRPGSKNYFGGTQKSLSFSKVSLDMLKLSAQYVRRSGANTEPRVKHCTSTAALPLQVHTQLWVHTGFPQGLSLLLSPITECTRVYAEEASLC